MKIPGFDELVRTLKRDRIGRIQRAPLSDRDTRRDSVQNLSIVSVLLATSAFVALHNHRSSRGHHGLAEARPKATATSYCH
jgi:hypothetical protein